MGGTAETNGARCATSRASHMHALDEGDEEEGGV